MTLANQGRHRESGEAFAQVLAIFERTLDPGHWRIANTARNVGQLLALQGRYEEALPHLERSLEINRDYRDGTHRVTYQRGQRAMIWLGLNQVERARNELAEARLGLVVSGASPPDMDFQADLELYRAWGLSHPLMLEILHTQRP